MTWTHHEKCSVKNYVKMTCTRLFFQLVLTLSQ